MSLDYFYTHPEYWEGEKNAFVKSEMNECKTYLESKLADIIHPDYLKQFAVILAYAASEKLQEAEDLTNKLNVNRRHIWATLDDEDMFEKLLEDYFGSYREDWEV